MLPADPTLTQVLLVEDEVNAFERCAQIVRDHPRLELAHGVNCFRDGIRVMENEGDRLGLLLTDLQLGDGDGADLIRRWRDMHGPARPAMVISVFGDVTSVIRAIEAGADGYLLKGGEDHDMLDSLTTVLDGGAPISAAVAGHLLKRVRQSAAPDLKDADTAPPEQSLSAREVEVLSALARGGSYKEVARKMDISPNTVANHVKKIYEKLAVTSRGEAVYQAIKSGLIDLSEH